MEDIFTPGRLKEYEEYLRRRRREWGTVSTYMRTLQAVYNRRTPPGHPNHNPTLFKNVYTKVESHTKRSLTKEQMETLMYADFSKLPKEIQEALAYFLLMFLLRGMPFIDFAYMQKSDVKGDFLVYCRHKTGRKMVVHISREAKALLEAYRNKNATSPYLFPIMDSKVARLDIRNSANQHLQIGAIGFMKCRTIGPLFKPAEFVEVGDVRAMTAMDVSYQAVKNLNDATLLDGGGAIPYQEGMFYLHPRKDGDQLVLIIQGTLDFGIGAQDVAYEIPIATKIAANMRYRMDIKLNERNEIVVSSVYSVEDWGDLGDSELEHTVIQPAVNDKNLKALAAEGAYKGKGGVESYEMSFVGGTGTEELVTDPDHTSDNILKAIAAKPAAYAVNFRT